MGVVYVKIHRNGQQTTTHFVDLEKLPDDHAMKICILESITDNGRLVNINPTLAYKGQWMQCLVDPPCYVVAKALLVEF